MDLMALGLVLVVTGQCRLGIVGGQRLSCIEIEAHPNSLWGKKRPLLEGHGVSHKSPHLRTEIPAALFVLGLWDLMMPVPGLISYIFFSADLPFPFSSHLAEKDPMGGKKSVLACTSPILTERKHIFFLTGYWELLSCDPPVYVLGSFWSGQLA